MKTKRLFIFDLDGTLADAYLAIQRSMNYTLKNLGYPPVSLLEVKRKVGKGDKRFITSFFPEKDEEKAIEIYRRHHKKSLLRYSKPKPYSRELLYMLKRRKKIIAIASNRPSYFTNLIIKKTGLARYIDLVLCADEINSLKPKPKILNVIMRKFQVKKQDTVYIGDMDIDMETARRARVDAIFVTGGSSSLKSVKKYRKKVISKLNKILTIYQ
ncbi:MAG: HAD family hydrolase [Candidatus Omnitrophota bacterium]|nr:HAD family hydrolase [Candidatus Omnitrophota bacterium]